MRIDQAVNIEDLHRMAKRRLPKVAFDFIEGGLEDERGLDRNTAAFHKHNLLPRYLVDVSKRDQSQTIFGRTYSSPFGISPTGGAGLFRRGAGRRAALSLKPALLAEALTHPGWVAEYIRHGGTPALENWLPYAGAGASAEDTVKFNRAQVPAHAQTWRDLEKYRRLFPRTLIVKGIMHPADAIRAAELGCEGIIVSNHGGRQLDQAPASLEVLPAIKAAVGDRMTVMLDSGVRRGADILIAMCLGAQFCFFGRPTLYGAVAGGLPGVKRAVDIFRGEIDLVMGQIGCPSLNQLGPDFLWRDDWPRNA